MCKINNNIRKKILFVNHLGVKYYQNLKLIICIHISSIFRQSLARITVCLEEESKRKYHFN